jgi:hypothetical protein
MEKVGERERFFYIKIHACTPLMLFMDVCVHLHFRKLPHLSKGMLCSWCVQKNSPENCATGKIFHLFSTRLLICLFIFCWWLKWSSKVFVLFFPFHWKKKKHFLHHTQAFVNECTNCGSNSFRWFGGSIWNF